MAEQQDGSTEDGKKSTSAGEAGIESIKGDFGAKNRKRLIDAYFNEAGLTFTPQEAWEHVYRLLLWADQTTGLLISNDLQQGPSRRSGVA